MGRVIACCALVAIATALVAGAGKSDIADAAQNGNRAAVQKLILQKTDVNAPQVDGATALHWAVYRQDLELADLLIRAGANVKAANRTGMTPLAMAAIYGNAALIDRLIKAGADAKQKGPNGETMLMFAARNGNPQAVQVLLEAGAEVNARETIRGTTALMWAIEQKHPEAVKVLLAGGADHSAKSGGAGLPRNYMANRQPARGRARTGSAPASSGRGHYLRRAARYRSEVRPRGRRTARSRTGSRSGRQSTPGWWAARWCRGSGDCYANARSHTTCCPDADR
jgi:ankyrin repeat protein